MDYQRVLDQFIADRLSKYSNKEPAKGRERHHIKPRTLGGMDDPGNIISLIPSDHLFAHLLLAKIHGGYLISAFYLMLNNSRYQGRRSRRQYTKMRELLVETVGARTRGKPQHPNLVLAIARSNATRDWSWEARPEGQRRALASTWGRPQHPKSIEALERAQKLPRSPAQLIALAENRKKAHTPECMARTWAGSKLTRERKKAAAKQSPPT